MRIIQIRSHYRLCGTASSTLELTTTKSGRPDTLLVVFEGSSTASAADGTYQFTVTAKLDACQGDPCHGVPCIDNDDGTYSCQFPGKLLFICWSTSLTYKY